MKGTLSQKLRVESGRAGLAMNVKKTKTMMIISRDPERKTVVI